MSLEDLRHNIQSILEGVEKHDIVIEKSKNVSDKKQLKKLGAELEDIKDFIFKLGKKLVKLIEHERGTIKA